MFEKIYEIYGADILYLYEYTPFYGGNSIQNETDRHIMNIKNQKFYNPEDPDFWKEEKRKESISFFKNVLKEEFTNIKKSGDKLEKIVRDYLERLKDVRDYED